MRDLEKTTFVGFIHMRNGVWKTYCLRPSKKNLHRNRQANVGELLMQP